MFETGEGEVSLGGLKGSPRTTRNKLTHRDRGETMEMYPMENDSWLLAGFDQSGPVQA
jgi:hypothetical protein